jgi:hypothetical protein
MSFNLPLSIKDTLPQQSTTTFEYDSDNARVIKVENNVRLTSLPLLREPSLL